MSEDNSNIEDEVSTTEAETSEQTVTAEANPTGGTQLTVGDLKTMVRVIQVGANRGAYNAEELEAVGKLYKTIVHFLAEGGHITISETPPVDPNAPKDTPPIEDDVAGDEMASDTAELESLQETTEEEEK